MKKILFSLIAILITLECWSQTCIAPTNLSSVQSGNNRIISWTPGGSETQWLLQYSLSTDTSFVNSTSVNLVSNQDTIRGLNPSTSYKVRVKAICSATDSSSWSSTYSFTTGCITISSLPWYESFDTYGISYPPFSNMISPTCWSMSCYGTAIPYIYTYCYSSPGSFYIKSLANQYTIVMTPRIDNSIPINTLRAKFKLLKSNINCRLSIGVMSNTTDTSSFTEIAVVSPSILSAWEDTEVWFNSYTGSGKYIAFKSNDTISNSVLLDNLELSLIPSCLNPTNLVANNISTTSASISWTSGQNETQWALEYKPSTTSWANATTINNITSNNYTLTGLYGSTAYDVRVKAVCSSTNESEWSNISFYTVISSLPWSESFDSYGTDMKFPFAWTKLHDPLTSTSSIFSIHYSNPTSLRLLSSANSNLIVISPKFDTSIHINTLRAKLKIKIYDASNGLSVGVMSNPNDTSSFVQIEELMPTELETWKDFEVWFNSYTGSGQYIAFKSNNTIFNNVYLDNLEISLLPSCISPTNLRVTNITPTSAKVAWYANNNATQWEIEYKPYSDTSWQNAVRVSNITTNPFTLNNLPPSTVLSLRIRTICSATDSSEWTYYPEKIHGDNFDFSYGNFIDWKGYTAYNNSHDFTRSFTTWIQTIGDTNEIISSDIYLKVNSDTSAFDTHVQNLKTIPSGYKNSVRINYDTINNWSTVSKASQITYDIDVDYTNYLLSLYYAIIYRENNYVGITGPSFTLEVLNLDYSNGSYVENGRVTPDAYYDTIGVYSPAGWNNSLDQTSTKFYWKPWTKMQVDLSSKIGQKVRVKVTTARANSTYLKGYSYFAGKTEGFEEGTCYPPLVVNVDSVGSTYASISFNKNFPTDSNWVIQYREIGDSAWNYINFDTNNYLLSNLSPEANYEAFIQTLCTDSTYSDSSYVFNFSTHTLYIDSMFNNKTAYLCGKYFYDDGGEDNYHSNNSNYTFTLCPTRKTNESLSVKRASVNFEEFSLGQGDVMKAYSGRSINPQTQLSIGNTNNFTGNFLENKSLIANLSDTSGCITFNLITNASDSSSGFKAYVDCFDRCQRVIADLDTFFVKYDTLGNTSTHLLKTITDSVYSPSDSSWTINTYRSVDFCEGDLIELIAKPRFPDNNSHYNQSINNCIYYWSFGDRYYDTIHYNNMVGHIWNVPKAYELELSILDTSFSYLNGIGCKSENSINTKIRITKNPIKTIKAPIEICSGTPFMLNVGYDTTSTIVIDSIKRVERVSGLFDSIVIIPDGPNCPSQFIETSIYFNEFLPNEVFDNVNDLRSICINMEHSFVGDIQIDLFCPSGQKTILKHFDHSQGSDMGIPNYTSIGCEMSATNAPGIGWTYCYSNQYLDSAKGVISGNMPSPIDSSNTINNSKYYQTPVQTATSASTGWETPDLNGLNTLIGCPLNGEWKLRIYDYWGADNGFLFWWKLDLGQITTWDYQAKLDTVIVEGLNNYNLSNDSVIITPTIDTSGLLRYNVKVVDDFGCIWDTATYLNVAQTPIVNLGGDTSNCEQFSVMLDAGNIGATNYLWLPTGDTTQSILAQSFSSPDSSITYIAQVTNYNGSIYCFGIDSINLIVNPTPNTPTNLAVQARPTYLEITWSGNGTSYEVYRNDTLIAISTQPIYYDSNVVDETNYCYKIKALIENCESELSNIACRTYTGLENIINNDLSVIIYPNPTNDKTRLEIKGLKFNADVIVYDIYGRAIKTYKLNTNQNELEIDVKEFAKGVYNVKVTNSYCNITKKLIVK
ncbi:MAG: fibronectin type III domain-containing protein [Bacteroidales bacterium]|jgi:subtilisin-like proprotein convertase family protein